MRNLLSPGKNHSFDALAFKHHEWKLADGGRIEAGSPVGDRKTFRNLSLYSLSTNSNLHDRKYQHKGVNAYSPLHDVGDHFSVIWNIPTEEFHLTKEGVTKTIIRRLFEDTVADYARDILTRWTTVYESTRVFSETARRTRPISTGTMKGSEFGVILFSAFPVLVDILQDYQFLHW